MGAKSIRKHVYIRNRYLDLNKESSVILKLSAISSRTVKNIFDYVSIFGLACPMLHETLRYFIAVLLCNIFQTHLTDLF